MKWLIACAVALAGIVAGVLVYRHLHQPAAAVATDSLAVVAVSTVPVRVAPMVNRIVSYGNLVPLRSVNIVSDGPAQITGLLFTDGAEVQAGTPLVVLDARVAQAQAQASRAQAEADVQNLRRTQSLTRQGLDSTYSLEQAQSRAAVSQSDLSIKERRLDQLTLRAPFAGLLGSHRVDVGAFVNSTDTIVRLDDASELQIEFRMPSVVTLKVANGMAVRVQVPNDELSVDGKLSFIDPAVSTDTRSVLLRAVVPNGGKRLRPGLFVRVALDLDTHPKALVVPVEAITRELSTSSVFVVDAQGIAHQVSVTTGLSDGTSVELLTGVKAGDQVVSVGQFRLRDGDRVKVIPAPPAKSAA